LQNGAKDYVISVVASFEIEKNKAVLAMTFTKSNYLWLGLEKGGLKVVQPLLHDAARVRSKSSVFEDFILIGKQPFVEVHSSQPHSAMVYSLLQVGEDVWSCSKDGAIKVWELQNARDFEVVTELAELIGHEGSVYQMCLCGPDVVVSVGADMFVRTWSAIHDKVRANHPRRENVFILKHETTEWLRTTLKG
jgi:WD40 repeat protein